MKTWATPRLNTSSRLSHWLMNSAANWASSSFSFASTTASSRRRMGSPSSPTAGGSWAASAGLSALRSASAASYRSRFSCRAFATVTYCSLAARACLMRATMSFCTSDMPLVPSTSVRMPYLDSHLVMRLASWLNIISFCWSMAWSETVGRSSCTRLDTLSSGGGAYSMWYSIPLDGSCLCPEKRENTVELGTSTSTTRSKPLISYAGSGSGGVGRASSPAWSSASSGRPSSASSPAGAGAGAGAGPSCGLGGRWGSSILAFTGS
mmetsp:Transcript_11587/g.20939  ORF Transcript_11587/g.20939 Transcript_11587/m.20939 type:complete len:265 (+) Transcript_11587:2130-2924(+)